MRASFPSNGVCLSPTIIEMNKSKAILVVVLVFVAGIVVGAVGMRQVARRVVQRALLHPEAIQQRIGADLNRRLELDQEQRQKVNAILADTQSQLRELRRRNQPEFFQIMSNAQVEISAVLSPEQREKFKKFREQYRPFLQPR